MGLMMSLYRYLHPESFFVFALNCCGTAAHTRQARRHSSCTHHHVRMAEAILFNLHYLDFEITLICGWVPLWSNFGLFGATSEGADMIRCC